MSVTFIQAADLHLPAGAGELQHGVDADAHLARAIALINALQPACTVICGDLAAGGSEAAYRRLRGLLGRLEAPAHLLLGPRDDPAAFRAVFGPAEPPGRAVALDGARLLLLESAVPGEEAGRLGAEPLAWLEGELAAHPAEPAWLFLHHPPLPIYQRWLDRSGLREPEPLLALLSRHPQVAGVCYGHVHQSRRWRIDRTLFLGVPALAFQFAGVGQEGPVIGAVGAAFRRVELLPGGVRSWLHFLDGEVAEEPSLEATPVYVR